MLTTGLIAVTTLGAWALPAGRGVRGAGALDPEHRRTTFPVAGAAGYSDSFGAPRSGGRTHQGVDIFGTKMQPLISTVRGTVAWIRYPAVGNSGNMISIEDDDGWQYWYIHVNNDTPGTDDGLAPIELAFPQGIEEGAVVEPGQTVAYLGDSGNAEGTPPHLHFEIHRPDGSVVNPWASLRLSQGLRAHDRCRYDSNPPAHPSAGSAGGYWVLGADGGIFSFGDAEFFGSVPGLGLPSRVTTIRMEPVESQQGYWVLGADGGIFSFGDAEFFGSVPGLGLRGVTAVDLRATASGKGYWVLGADGGIFAFGDAPFFGSVPGVGIRTEVRRIVPTPSGAGYWVLGADGGVFSFGDAEFFGSLPGLGLGRVPSVTMAPTPTGDGYWVLGADGGIFSFGDAAFFGSIPGFGLCAWPQGVDLVAAPSGGGYWILANDGSVWVYGDARHLGAVNALGLTSFAPTVDLAATLPGADAQS